MSSLRSEGEGQKKASQKRARNKRREFIMSLVRKRGEHVILQIRINHFIVE